VHELTGPRQCQPDLSASAFTERRCLVGYSRISHGLIGALPDISNNVGSVNLFFERTSPFTLKSAVRQSQSAGRGLRLEGRLQSQFPSTMITES
jgi:hypothetical protein